MEEKHISLPPSFSLVKDKVISSWEFPSSSVVRTLHLHSQGPEFNLWLGTKIPQAPRHSQKKRKKKRIKLLVLKVKLRAASPSPTNGVLTKEQTSNINKTKANFKSIFFRPLESGKIQGKGKIIVITAVNVCVQHSRWQKRVSAASCDPWNFGSIPAVKGRIATCSVGSSRGQQ